MNCLEAWRNQVQPVQPVDNVGTAAAATGRARGWARIAATVTATVTAMSAAMIGAAAVLMTARPAGSAEPDTAAAERYVALFNGKDLSGWKAEGRAAWEVRDGAIVGRQGPGGAAGDLLSEEQYDNFELAVTFKVDWPANTGVWYRYQSADKAYQADILEYKEPLAFTGSLYCTGEMFLTTNRDPKLVRRDDWNTLVIRAAGDRHVILLNGVKVADVRDDTSDVGRVGFQVHAGEEFADMQVTIKEVLLRRLGK